MNKNLHIPNELLAKYFAHEATDEEIKAVESWAGSSLGNREIFQQYHGVWIDTGVIAPLLPEESFDVEVAWQKVKAKKVKRLNTSNNTWLSTAWKIAASIILAFGLGWFIYQFYSVSSEHEYFTETEIATVKLADGSGVVLNKNSSLKYPKKFGENGRKVELNGEAFFNVEPDPDKPFIIHVGEASVQVLGTSFNVDGGTPGTIEVVVETGTVLFSAGRENMILKAGDKGIYHVEKRQLKVDQKEKTGADQFWRTKKLTFTGETLYEVIEVLEKEFKVQIAFEHPAISNCHIAVTFENESVDDILQIIALTHDLEIITHNDHYFLSGKGCTKEPS